MDTKSELPALPQRVAKSVPLEATAAIAFAQEDRQPSAPLAIARAAGLRCLSATHDAKAQEHTQVSSPGARAARQRSLVIDMALSHRTVPRRIATPSKPSFQLRLYGLRPCHCNSYSRLLLSIQAWAKKGGKKLPPPATLNRLLDPKTAASGGCLDPLRGTSSDESQHNQFSA